jgi:cytochrome c556
MRPKTKEGDRMIFRTALAVSAVAIGVTAVAAQSDPIASRKALMKGNGDQAKIGAAMAKGEAPFDLAKAKTIFVTFVDASGKMPSLFPDNTKTGGETAATPKVWEDPADFKARFEKFGADAKVAEDKVTDLDSFKVQFGVVVKNCGGCHELYRVKKT